MQGNCAESTGLVDPTLLHTLAEDGGEMVLLLPGELEWDTWGSLVLAPAGALAAAGLSRLGSLTWGRYRCCLIWTLVLAGALCQGNQGLTVGTEPALGGPREPAMRGAGARSALLPGVSGQKG